MKTTKPLVALLLTLALFLTGCATTNPAVTLALEQVAARVVLSKLPADQQAEVRTYASSVAVLVRSLDPAHPVSVEKFQALVNQWLPADANTYEPLITLIVSSYASSIASKVSDSGTVSPQRIEQLARALDAFAR